MTRVHAGDGSLVAEYARERRLYVPIQAVPKQVINGFRAAEDKNFYEHGGLDFTGIAPRRRQLCAEFQFQPQTAGRLDHYAAGRQELLADKRGFVHPQDQGSAAGARRSSALIRRTRSSSFT